jgi:hypothetical protein
MIAGVIGGPQQHRPHSCRIACPEIFPGEDCLGFVALEGESDSPDMVSHRNGGCTQCPDLFGQMSIENGRLDACSFHNRFRQINCSLEHLAKGRK